MSAETLLFGAVDLRSVCLPEDLNDFFSSAEPRGDLDSYPGVDGASGADRPFGEKVATGTLSVEGTTFAAVRDAVAAVKAILRVNRQQTLTRRKVTGAGNLDATQAVIVRAAAERWDGGLSCTLIVDVELLDGIWHGASTNIASAAGTQAVLGDTRTRRMTVTLPAGAARTVTNTTAGNGYQFTFGATVPAGGVLVDVEARTATAITGGADLSGSLSWTKDALMQLEAGSNTLTVSGGSASIDYQPAYL